MSKSDKQAEKAERLAAALRQNLRRRKAQERGTAGSDSDDKETGDRA